MDTTIPYYHNDAAYQSAYRLWQHAREHAPKVVEDESDALARYNDARITLEDVTRRALVGKASEADKQAAQKTLDRAHQVYANAIISREVNDELLAELGGDGEKGVAVTEAAARDKTAKALRERFIEALTTLRDQLQAAAETNKLLDELYTAAQIQDLLRETGIVSLAWGELVNEYGSNSRLNAWNAEVKELLARLEALTKVAA